MSTVNLPELQKIIMNLRKNQSKFAQMEIKRRVSFITRLGNILERRKHDYAHLMAIEMGKPVTVGMQEIEKCISLCDYSVNYAQKALTEERGKTHHGVSEVHYEALGTILNIVPWNYPFWLALRSAIPTLCAGNAVLIKHSSAVPKCSTALDKLFADSGLEDYVRSIQARPEVINQVIEKKLVDGVSVIGSAETGAIVASKAAAKLIPQVLELGGSDAFVVFDDADIKLAAQEVIASRMLNSGQNCDSAKRLFVSAKIAREFEQLLVEEITKLSIGNPLNPITAIGPMIDEQSVRRMEGYVLEAKHKGARLIHGGHKLKRAGFYFMPTILADCSTEMRVFKEEVFGPILAMATFKTEQEAIDMANNTKYGLGASIWTKNKDRIERMTKNLQVGIIGINKRVRSDIMLPFGGIKASGYGRELGTLGFRAFTNVKSVSFG